MLKAAVRALGDLVSPDFRSILWKAVGLALLLFAAILIGVQLGFYFLTFVPWPWLETTLAIGTGLGLVVAFFFLMSPVTAMFAGLYLDTVAEKVEVKHYPQGPAGRAQPTLKSIRLALQFGLLVLAVNLLALPLLFTGIGVVALVLVNAYLISREYFEMAAMRVMPVEDARELRRQNAMSVLIAGLLPALLALVPIVNLTVPLFATSYFVHLFRQARASSA
ncbi:MAG: sulfate transporter family protein [Rhizobiales bacterium]|nr:sulfate transporter family protein [Hyphomicrobiales bacterium]